MIDINELRRLASRSIGITVSSPVSPAGLIEILDRLEAAEKERDALRAKIEQMERQEPVAWWGRGPRDGRIEFSVHRPAPSVMRDFAVTPLYALPVAQPELNLSDPAVQKRLATQWGYVQKPHPDCDSGCMFQCAQPASSVPDEEAAYSEWFHGEQGVAYDGMWAFAKAAWMARAALNAAPKPEGE